MSPVVSSSSPEKGSGHMEDRGPFMLGMESIMIVIAISVTIVRTYIRRQDLGRLRMEDWCCVGSTIVLIHMMIAHGFGVKYGVGRHIWDLHFSNQAIISSIKTGYVGRILYPFATGLTRQSVLCLLLRIFPYKTFRRVIIFMIVVNITASLISCGAVAFQCMPISNIFSPFVNQTGHRNGCLSAQNLAYSIPAVNLLLDVSVALLPVRMIVTMRLSWKRKVMIVAMLGLGALACVASGVRLLSIHNTFGKPDPTWSAVEICLWAFAEVTIGIVCVSVPALRPLWTKIRFCNRLSSPKSTMDRHSLTPANQTGSGSHPRSSFALGSLKRPDRTKVRLQMHDNGSVEQFRPNHVNRTITSIEGQGYGGSSMDERSEGEGGDDGEGELRRNGILRKMEVAVTISDRV